MAFVTAVAGAPAAPTGPGGPDGHLANTHNVIRHVAVELKNLRFLSFFRNPSFSTFLPLPVSGRLANTPEPVYRG